MKAEWFDGKYGSTEYLRAGKMQLGSITWDNGSYVGSTFDGRRSKPTPDREKVKTWVVASCINLAKFVIEQCEEPVPYAPESK